MGNSEKPKQNNLLAQKEQSIALLENAENSAFQFSVPQIEYPLGGSSKKGSHVYFLLQVFWVILWFCQIVLLYNINVVLMSQWHYLTSQ